MGSRVHICGQVPCCLWLKCSRCHSDVSDGVLRPSRYPHEGLDLCPLGPLLWAFSPSAPGQFLGSLSPASTLIYYSFDIAFDHGTFTKE